MSSASRSGSSSSTCSGDRPDASGSSTSVTRIRSPRTHGRPPHWSGFTVIRSASAATGVSPVTGYTAMLIRCTAWRPWRRSLVTRDRTPLPERVFPPASHAIHAAHRRVPDDRGGEAEDVSTTSTETLLERIDAVRAKWVGNPATPGRPSSRRTDPRLGGAPVVHDRGRHNAVHTTGLAEVLQHLIAQQRPGNGLDAGWTRQCAAATAIFRTVSRRAG